MSLYRVYDRQIAFHRAFVDFGAGVTGALMLSQAVYWASRSSSGDGWFYKTQQEWEEETGLTRYEQEGARKKLVEAGVLQERKIGVPCRLFYRANMELIHEKITSSQYAEIPQTGMRENPKQECGKPADIHTEITTENKTSLEPQAPRVPFEKILDLYKTTCVPTFKASPMLTDERRKNILACWKYKVGGKPVFQSADFWKHFFDHCLLNPHWRGENDRGWRASLEFITRRVNMERVVSEILAEAEGNVA